MEEHSTKEKGTLGMARSQSQKKILITGATGFVGIHLLTDLIETPEVTAIYVLTRAPSGDDEYVPLRDALRKFALDRPLSSEKLRMVGGDICQPRLGINAMNYEEICAEVDVIYHVAARVNHIRSYDALKPANVDSVSEILTIASRMKPKVVNFVSTLGSAVRKDSHGRYVEDFPDETELNSDMGYLLSKWEGERLMGDFDRAGRHANIFRLGYISGHSKTGAALCHDNQLMLFIKSCIQMGFAPTLNRLVNLTPIDLTTQVMNLPQFREQGGQVINLVNCSEYISWNELVEWLNVQGHPIKMISFPEWQRKLIADGEGNPLYRFLPLYGQPDAYEKILRFGKEIHNFRTEKMEELDAKGLIKLPPLKYSLLECYFAYLYTVNFISHPQLAV